MDRGKIVVRLSAIKPGFYYLHVDLVKGKQLLFEKVLTFAVDLRRYYAPVTRPSDFKLFWWQQEHILGQTAINPVLKKYQKI